MKELQDRGMDAQQLLEHVVVLEDEINALRELSSKETRETRERLDALEKMLVLRSGNPIENANTSVLYINTTNNTTNNVNVTVNVNVVGKEDASHLTTEFLERSIQMEDGGGRGIIEVVKKLHYDPEKQENHNVRITSIKDWQLGLIECKLAKGWLMSQKAALYRAMWLGGWRHASRVWADWECESVIRQKLARSPNASKIEAFVAFVEDIRVRLSVVVKPNATEEELAKYRAKIDRAEKDLRKIYFKPMDALLRTEYIKRKQAEADAKRAGPVAGKAIPGPPNVQPPAPVVAPAPTVMHPAQDDEEEDIGAFLAQSLTESESESESDDVAPAEEERRCPYEEPCEPCEA
jgi:hypothetical protein